MLENKYFIENSNGYQYDVKNTALDKYFLCIIKEFNPGVVVIDRVERIYNNPKGNNDGFRILVDRLWLRGLSKDKVRVDLWQKRNSKVTH